MAIVSRIATLRHTTAAGAASRTIIATADTQDSSAGASVVVTVTQTTTGAAPPAVPTTLTLNYYDDAGGLIEAVTLTPGSASQTDTFFFTATGLSGGANRAGTVEIALRAQNTTAGATGTYNIETDGSPNTPQTGASTTLDRGWIRGATTAVTAISNVSAGGAKPATLAYPDSVFHRTVLGAALFVSRTLTASVKAGATTRQTGATSSATQTFDATFGPIAAPTYTLLETLTADVSVGNATLTGQPATVLTSTLDTIESDPRLTLTQHLQVNDSTLAMSKNVPGFGRRVTDLGFVAVRVANARAEFQNGVTAAYSFRDAALLTAAKTASASTATSAGEVGWGPALAWDNPLPGGQWNNTVTVSDAAGAQATASHAYFLLARDPAIILIVSGGDASHTANHFVPGNPLTVGCVLRNTQLRKYASIDASPVPGVRIVRLNTSTGKGQFLAADGTTWTDIITAGVETAAVEHVLAQSPTDPNVWLKTFTAAQTTGWGTFDVAVIATAYNGGTPYPAAKVIDVTGPANGHAGYAFDPTGLFA